MPNLKLSFSWRKFACYFHAWPTKTFKMAYLTQSIQFNALYLVIALWTHLPWCHWHTATRGRGGVKLSPGEGVLGSTQHSTRANRLAESGQERWKVEQEGLAIPCLHVPHNKAAAGGVSHPSWDTKELLVFLCFHVQLYNPFLSGVMF